MISVDDLYRQTCDYIASIRKLPEATYRLQFHAGFTFQDARSITPYLHDLGITHCYASPYLQSRPGSQHGYDITDHRTVNPELGGVDDYYAFVNDLRMRGMGQIIDMVPNHMGISGNSNTWWNDVLENGATSTYAGYFDIAWEDSPRPELYGRVLLPVLGDPYGKALEAQQIKLRFEAGVFTIAYFDHCFPVGPRSYAMVLGHGLENLESGLSDDPSSLLEFKSILTSISHLPEQSEKDVEKIAEYHREKDVIKRRLAKLVDDCTPIRDFIEQTITRFNGQCGDPASFDLLDRLLDKQAYRLSYWRVAADEINYRRFFDINELAALSMEKFEVFNAAHELILRLLTEGKVDGLRIDHPDGLYDPKEYLHRLQKHFFLGCAFKVFQSAPEHQVQEWKELEAPLLDRIIAGKETSKKNLYIVVEKILAAAEELPAEWETDGTSGYDFLIMVNGLFIDSGAADAFTHFYKQWIGDEATFAELAYQKKFLVLRDALSSELHMLGRQLDRIAQKNRYSKDFTQNSLRFALREIIACFPVYRSYISDEGVSEPDRRHVQAAVRRAIKRNPTVSRSLFNFVRDMLLGKYSESANVEDRAEQRRFAGKFQQVTSPVTAKGVEDTAFYVYNRMVSLNEVGGDPSAFGASPQAIHRYFLNRQEKWPRALSPLATHDTKRGEDVRARLNVLSELPDEWRQKVVHWSKLNENHRLDVDEGQAPDRNEEYFIYQSLLGSWPLEVDEQEQWQSFVKRIKAYLIKALHEAKVHSSWINPNEAYDDAILQFITRILDENLNPEFLKDLREFKRRISHFGLLNSLSQTLLKIACPGVADTYQGTELWDFSLVDPDNRRPVDYAKRSRLLKEIDEGVAKAGSDRRELLSELLRTMEDGRVKMYVTAQALRCRREMTGLFSLGEYIPGETSGKLKENTFGFARRLGDDVAVIAVPRLMTRLANDSDNLPLGMRAWRDTKLHLPIAAKGIAWTDVFTGRQVKSVADGDRTSWEMGDLLADFPVALLIAQR